MSNRGAVLALAFLVCACGSRDRHDVSLISAGDSVELLTTAVSIAMDSLASYGPYDLVLIPRQVDGRDSTWTAITPDVAGRVAQRDPRVRLRRVFEDFDGCPTGVSPGAAECDLLDRGLLLYLETITPSPDSAGVTLHLGVGEPPPPGGDGRFAHGWVIHFRRDGRRWIASGIQDVWVS